MWYYACSWDVKGDFTLNSVAQIHTSVTLLTSRDLAWSSGRLTCQHASQISVVAHISWDVTDMASVLQTLPVVSGNGGNAYWKNAPIHVLYGTKSPGYRDQHMRANAWKALEKELKIEHKFYVSSRDVRIVGPRFNPLNPELNPICYLLALLAHHFLHVSRISVKSLTLRRLMSYIYIYIYIWSTYSWCF